MKKARAIFIGSLIVMLLIFSCKNEPIKHIKSHDGVNISFDNEGKGKPTIILVHGWSNTKDIWKDQLTHFSKKYQVIAVDLPGFGESGNNRTDWSMQAYGNDISNIINNLNLKEVVLVGFSMGGPAVIEAANKTPDQVLGVVLVDNLQEIEEKIPPQMFEMIDSTMMYLIKHPTKEALVSGGFFKYNTDESTQRVVSMVEGSSHIGWSESLIGILKWQNELAINSVKNVKAPIHAINSDIKPTNELSFRKYAPFFKAKIVNDVGHVIMWDDPDEFNRLLEESIQEFIMN